MIIIIIINKAILIFFNVGWRKGADQNYWRERQPLKIIIYNGVEPVYFLNAFTFTLCN